MEREELDVLMQNDQTLKKGELKNTHDGKVYWVGTYQGTSTAYKASSRLRDRYPKANVEVRGTPFGPYVKEVVVNWD